MGSNQETLTVYQEYFDEYVDGTPQVTESPYKEWIDELLARVDTQTPILEIGSAFGRDADYIKNAGYANITPTDAFDAAVASLKQRGFVNAHKLNLLTDDIEGRYGLVIAIAVFLHFTETEFVSVLRKLQGPLSEKGILGFTVKQGDGEEWSEHKMGAPRFFHYWQMEPLRRSVEDCGYAVLDIRNTDESQKWLAVTCQPKEL